VTVPEDPVEALDYFAVEAGHVVETLLDALGAGTDKAVPAQLAIAAMMICLQESIVSNCRPPFFWSKTLAMRLADLRDIRRPNNPSVPGYDPNWVQPS
jgi:hypothetical protein